MAEFLPSGVRALLPAEGGRPKADYERIIQWIRLPRFGGNFPHNWPKFLNPNLPARSRASFLDHLATVLESGAWPLDRLDDVLIAWWELSLDQPIHGEPVASDDAVPVAAPQVLADWDRDRRPAIERFLRQWPDAQRLDWNPQSILKVMGYAVGVRGVPTIERRRVITDVLFLPESLLPAGQGSFWGVRGTRRRVRAIVRMVKTFRNLAAARTHGDWSKACQHWEADLEWIGGAWASNAQ
jgi:hypothetical protein